MCWDMIENYRKDSSNQFTTLVESNLKIQKWNAIISLQGGLLKWCNIFCHNPLKKLYGLLLHNKHVWNADFFPFVWLWSYCNVKVKAYKQV
jgi:hypothetical protein